jgi:hypothetical protein
MAGNVFADFFISSDIPPGVVDADARNPDVSRRFADVVPALPICVSTRVGWT